MSENGSRYEITYEITSGDLYAFQLRAARKSPLVRKTRRNTYLAVSVLFVLLSINPLFGPGTLKTKILMLGLPLIGFPVFAGLMMILERWFLRSTIEKLIADEKPDKGLLGEHTLILDEESVLERTEVGESRTLWSGIDRVEDESDYAFIYTSAAAAHVIPLRAFDSSDHARRFIAFARHQSLKATT